MTTPSVHPPHGHRPAREIEADLARLQAELAAAHASAAASASEPITDYTLHTTAGAPVQLSALFGPHQDLLLIHNMGRGCAYCTLWADGFIGLHRHITQRAALVLASPDDPGTLAAFAASRQWPFTCVSFAGTTLAADMGYQRTLPDGRVQPLPGVSALRLVPASDGAPLGIIRTNTTPFGPGDLYCPIWPLLGLLRDGAKGWAPTLPPPPAAPHTVTIGRS